MELIYKFPIF